MNKKNLIVCGCSFTQGHFLKKDKTWGGYVANKLNLKLHNIAEGGQGNEYISNKTISYLLNNSELINDSIVMIGWSDSNRLMGTFERSDGALEYVTIRPFDFAEDENSIYQRGAWRDNLDTYHSYVKKHYKILGRFYSSFAYCLYKTYYSIYILKHFLESNNIPYLFFDAVSQNKMISLETEDNSYKKIKLQGNHDDVLEFLENIPNWITDSYLNKTIESKIFDDKYISFDNKSMLAKMFEIDYKKLTEGNPGHPNELAADIFSDMIIKEYGKLYN